MSKIKLTYSSELMKNYLHAEIMSPQDKFEALQANDGHSLLFSIGTDGAFYLVKEESGLSAAGWSKTDLSSAQIKRDFSGQTNVICRAFDTGQSIKDGSLGLAMAVETDKGDHLYLSLKNSNKDISWAKNLNWVAYEYDNPNTALSKLIIVNAFFCELSEGKQYIIIDVLRDPSSAANDISRYYIDPTKTGGYFWHSIDLPVDIESERYTSCIGRLSKGYVDGLYTSGRAGTSGQLIFSPVINAFGDGPPTPVRLNLPGGAIPESIASTRNTDSSTDLYVFSGSSLYYFASSNQKDSALGVLLITNDIFEDTSHLYAYKSNNKVFIWGLNRANEVFYITCPADGIETPNSWSHPVPILTGVDSISPYVNLINNGNTFFAVGEDSLCKMMQSPSTGLWTSQHITLPAPSPTTPAQSFSSYTTTIQLTDANNKPLVKSELLVSAATRSSFFINNLYYILDTKPIPIDTDAMGNITIIESVNSLHGVQISVAEKGGQSVQINPMKKPFNKVAKLNSVSSLKNAVITNSDGSTIPLVVPSTSDDDLKAVALSNQGLGKAYASSSSTTRTFNLNSNSVTNAIVLESFPDAIAADVGDIFRWLESGVEYIVKIVEDIASGIWHFIVTIAGKVYKCILDTVEAIVGAVVWVFDAIKTAIKDLIKFLEFLFEWEDILITHRVMKNVFKQFAQNSIDSLSGYKADIALVFTSLQDDVNKWANIPNFDQTLNSTTASNPPMAGQNSSPSNLGLHHFQGNAKEAASSFTPASITESIFEDLLKLLESEEETLVGAYNAIKTDIIDQFDSLTLTQIIEKFIAIIVDTLLQTAENILLAVVDVFIQLSEGIMELFSATIDIPVISWLYKEISGDDLSFLDLICLISAIPTTIIYKIGADATPFPKDDAFTKGLLSAESFEEMQSLFFTTSKAVASPQNSGTNMSFMTISDTRVLNENRLKTFSFVTSIFAFAGSIVVVITTGIQRAFHILKVDVPVAKTNALIEAIGNTAYISPNFAGLINFQTANWSQQMNNLLTGISLVKGYVNIPLATVSRTNKLSKISPFVETVINTVWNVPVIMNIIDNKDRWDTDYESLIPESVGNFAFNLGGMMELPIDLIEDPETKVASSGAQFILMLVYGICMPISGGIYKFQPNQNHG